MVIFDPLVYPMDTAWLNGKVPADHYRHTRPEYLRALERAHLVELPEDPDDSVEALKTAGTPSDTPPVKPQTLA
jgi:hypothetical protein